MYIDIKVTSNDEGTCLISSIACGLMMEWMKNYFHPLGHYRMQSKPLCGFWNWIVSGNIKITKIGQVRNTYL